MFENSDMIEHSSLSTLDCAMLHTTPDLIIVALEQLLCIKPHICSFMYCCIARPLIVRLRHFYTFVVMCPHFCSFFVLVCFFLVSNYIYIYLLVSYTPNIASSASVRYTHRLTYMYMLMHKISDTCTRLVLHKVQHFQSSYVIEHSSLSTQDCPMLHTTLDLHVAVSPYYNN